MPTTYAHLSGSSTYLAVVTAGSPAHNKGSYADLSTATPFDSSLCWWHISIQTALRLHLTDLAIGASGAEVVICENVPTQSGNDAGGIGTTNCELHVDIAAGSRLACATQSATASATLDMWVLLSSRPLKTLPDIVTYGADISTTRGTSIDPGAVADTKGTYTELAAMTSVDHDAWLVVVGNKADSSPVSAAWSVDFSTGANGVEVVAIPNFGLRTGSATGHDGMLPGARTFKSSIAGGSRLAVRAQCTTAAAADRTFDLTLHGMGYAV